MLGHLKALRWPLLAGAGTALVPLTVLLTGHTLVWRDTAQLMAPLRPLVVEALRELRIPGWNPFEGAGQPLFAQYLNGVLHPVSVAFAPFTASMDALIVALVVASAVGAWLAARVLGASPVAALGAAFAFALSGFVLGGAGNTQYLMSTATGPWVVAGLVAAAGRSWGWVGACAAVAALALAGDPGSVVAFTLAGGALAWRGHGRRALGPALAACLLGLGLAAVQLVPAALHIADTARGRGALQPDDLRRWAFVPWRTLELLAPGFFVGRPTSYLAPVFAALDGSTPDRFPFVPSAFVGAVTLALALVGALRVAWARWLAGLSLLFLWIAMGHRAGSQQLLSWVPVWGVLRYWEKMLGPLTFCLALASAAGIDALGTGASKLARRVAIAGLLLSLGLLLLFSLPPAPAIFGVEPGVAALARTRLQVGLVHAVLALAGLGAVAWLAARRAAWGAWGAVALVFVQSAAASPFALHPGNPAALAVRPPSLAAPPPGPRLAAPLGCDFAGPSRGLDPIDLLNACERRTGRPTTNAEAQIDSFPTYSALAPLRWDAVIRSGPFFWPIARRLGTTHVLARPPVSELEANLLGAALQGAGAPTVLDGGALVVWEIPHRPWAAFAGSARVVADIEGAKAALAEELTAGRDTVVVESTRPLGALSPGRLLTVDRRADELVLRAQSQGGGLLVVNDAWGRGWRAWIDGAETEILPADVLARAVRWPAGEHELRMRYEPPGLRAGLFITSGSALALIVVAVALARAARRRSSVRPG